MRKCVICGAEFETRNAGSRYCPECRDYIQTGKLPLCEDEPTKFVKPLDAWIAEAAACGLSYGRYRQCVERFGKSFDELKLG